jgi:two-component system, OmpR family, aerobic respiration control sensor histidine kinase ArcB
MQKNNCTANFVNLAKSNEKLNECILTISVGQEVHEGKNFIATLKLTNKHFKKCTIAVCDTLQRHSIAIITNSTQEIMYNAGRREGDQWINRNKSICDEHLSIPYAIKRWKNWFKSKEYYFYREKVDKLYFDDPKFVCIVDDLVQVFNNRITKRGYTFDNKIATKHSKEYLLEECAAMCIWYDEGYDVEIYPSIRNEAIEYTFSQIKKEVYGKLLRPVGLKFNKTQSLDDPTSKIALEEIINILPGHIYWKDKEGKFLGCNETQAKSYGFESANILIGKHDKEIIKADVAQKIRENDKEVMSSRRICTFEEKTFINKKIKWVLSQKAPIIDKNDEVLGIVGVSVDISDRKKLEKNLVRQAKLLEEALTEKDVHGRSLLKSVSLKFNEAQSFDDSTSKIALEKIINILPGHVYWKDKESKFLGCNDTQAKSYGFESSNTLIGKHDKDIIKADIAQKIIENDKEIMSSKQSCTFEEEAFINKKRKWVLSQKAPIIDKNDEVLGVVGVSIDISDKKKLEKSLIRQTKSLEEALTEKKRFLNNLSHEIRTPLHIITSISEELYQNINHFSKEEFKSFLSTLLQNSKSLVKLVTNLLEIAKSKQRKSYYHFERKNIIPIIQEIINEFSPVASISLNTDSKKIFTDIDELKISQVMRNIVDNAIKYGNDKSIVIELKELNPSKNIEIKIKNKGIGILEGEREKVFEAFFQGTNNQTKTGGTGLGLAICKEIILAHKGDVRVDQDKLNNTTVSFTIPYIK